MAVLRVFRLGVLGVKPQMLLLVTLSDVRQIEEAVLVPFDA